MKKYLLSCLALVVFTKTQAQVTAKDCTAAVNICTSASFSVAPAGSGFIDFTTASSVSNPLPGTAAMIPPGGGGCLYSGELNPTWMIINIQTPGTLEFSMGAGTGPGAQSGCYDWSMWVYNASSCTGINTNTLAPIRCCWNVACSGGTGLSSPANLPAGAFQNNFGAPINANCGDRFIMCFSNYSSVSTLVPLNFFGTAVVSCSPLSSTLSINSPSICFGAVATLSVPSSPGTTYTWQPGGQTAPSITVSPASTTIYTLTAANACGVLTGTSAVVVSPPISISFSNTNGSCPSTLGSSTANVTGGVGGFTYSWSPGGSTSVSASNLTTGVYSLTATDAIGCTATSTTSIFAPAPISFSVSGGGQITCINTSVVLNATNTSTLSNVTYTWMPGNVTGSAFSATAAGVYTVVGQDQTVSSCTDTQTISVGQDLTAPSMSVSPLATQTIGCGQPCKQFTATTTSTTNIFGTWYDITSNPPVPLVGPSGGTVILCAGTPGTYAITFTNVITGCTNTQTVAVTSSTVVPTLTVTSVLGGFSVTCTKPCLPLNVNTSVVLGPTSYTWTNLTTNVSTMPATGGYTVCGTGANVPGQYAITIKDGLGCSITQTITIGIDTLRPAPTSTATLASLSPDSYTINCFTPSIVVTGISNPMYPASNYSWTIPPNLIQSNQTATISMVNVTATMPSSTNYTVLAMNPNNGCVGRKLVRFYKDVAVPPYTVVFTPTAITCANPCVAFSPNNSVPSNTTPITFTFTSPPPTQTATTLGALMCLPGPYTMTYQNAINGCTNVATTTVQLNVTPPATFAIAPINLNCGATTATIMAGHTGSNAAAGTFSYTWSSPPLAGMSCPGGISCYSTTANTPGNYYVTILNTVNGCRATNSVAVIDNGGVLPGVSFNVDPNTGFAPMSAFFDNTTVLQNVSSGTVTTTWNYGNGISVTTTSSSSSYSNSGGPNGSSTYQSAGNYTVFLVITQNTGTNTCIGTATAVIHVDLPSALETPNVFTPNGDGVNDVFMLQTTNLTEITCTIFDRWGVKMYDVTADKGNISWDGKNFSNKDVPAGTYFYILNAKGKDLKDYEEKGTISLFR